MRFIAGLTWAIRILQGKILSVLRLVKGTLTFDGGVDYILWKIKRHSGVTMEASPFLRRHPILAMLVLSWRLYRLGGIRSYIAHFGRGVKYHPHAFFYIDSPG